MSEGGSQRPGGPGKKRAAALQIELPCASLDDVRAKHPELRSRRFLARTKDVKPLDTVIRLELKLAGGAPCLRATSVVERVQTEPEPAMTLWLLAADDSGRELIAWMGGTPPPILKEATSEAPKAEPAAPPPPPSASAPLDEDSELVDPLSAFEAAAAAADRLAQEPDKPKVPPPPSPPQPKTAPPPARAAPAPAPKTGPPVAAKSPPPAPSTTPAPPAAKSPPAPPPAKAPPPVPPPRPQKLGTVKIVSRAVPAQRAEPEPAPPEPTDAEAGFAEDSAPADDVSQAAVRTEPPAPEAEFDWTTTPAAPADATSGVDPWGEPEAPAESAAPAEPPQTAANDDRPRNVPPPRPQSRRPAPPPLPRPTLGPVQSAPAADAAPEIVDDVIPERPAGPRKGPIIGIDLGTTNSCAAVVKEGKAFIVPSREGYNTIPSVVAMSDKGKLLVGHPARGQMLINPKNTVYG
ncbi:MAG TPA: Hsp70 family protein, partial [Myxococcales bacterium]|nr:Hsp70 family protein [Myxococcales bacterium]